MLILKIVCQVLLSASLCCHFNSYTIAYQVHENYPNKLWNYATTPKHILWQPRQHLPQNYPFPLTTPVIVEPELAPLVQSSGGFRSIIDHGTVEVTLQPPLQQYIRTLPTNKSALNVNTKLPLVHAKKTPKRSQETVTKPTEDQYANKYNKFVHTYFTTSLDKSAEQPTPKEVKKNVNQNTATVASGQDEASSGSTDDTEDASYEDESEEKDLASANNSKKIKKLPKRQVKRHCKRVYKNGQDCIICRNSKNGEKSEVCSYSTEFKPQSYAYENVNSYRTVKDANDDYDYGNDADDGDKNAAVQKDAEYNDADDESGSDSDNENDAYQQYESNESTNAEATDATDEDDDNDGEDAEGYNESDEKESEEYSSEYSEESASETKPIEVSQKSKKDKVAKPTYAVEESKCIRKSTPQQVCYFCTTPEGAKMANCYGAESYQKETKDLSNGRKKKKQRIFKRTISYSYEKDTAGVGNRLKRAKRQQNYFELLT